MSKFAKNIAVSATVLVLSFHCYDFMKISIAPKLIDEVPKWRRHGYLLNKSFYSSRGESIPYIYTEEFTPQIIKSIYCLYPKWIYRLAPRHFDEEEITTELRRNINNLKYVPEYQVSNDLVNFIIRTYITDNKSIGAYTISLILAQIPSHEILSSDIMEKIFDAAEDPAQLLMSFNLGYNYYTHSKRVMLYDFINEPNQIDSIKYKTAKFICGASDKEIDREKLIGGPWIGRLLLDKKIDIFKFGKIIFLDGEDFNYYIKRKNLEPSAVFGEQKQFDKTKNYIDANFYVNSYLGDGGLYFYLNDAYDEHRKRKNAIAIPPNAKICIDPRLPLVVSASEFSFKYIQIVEL